MRLLLILSILATTLTACASKQERIEQNNLKEEIAQTPQMKTETQMYQEEKEALKNASNLTSDQKSQLADLMAKSKKENQLIQTEISKTKMVLFKELLSDKENKTRISILENQLIKLNRKKMRNSISAYKEAKIIVGKNDESLERTFQLIDQRSLREPTL
jgi:hypothetical protein